MIAKKLSELAFAAAVFLVASSAVAPATGQTVRDVVSFTGSTQWGSPGATPVQGRDGKLFGTFLDPESGSGSDFSLALSGTFQVTHLFLTLAGGGGPSGLTLGTDEYFYGPAGFGAAEQGILYRISPSGSFTLLHTFLGGSDGSAPRSAPIEGTDGNFYGTTAGNAGNPGTIYKYSPSSGTLTTLYVFESVNGTSLSGLVQGSDGYLYGTALGGGANLYGTAFKFSTSGQPVFFYSFPGGTGGWAPSGPLIEATDGNFYGTTTLGGSTKQLGGFGTVFKLTPQGAVSILFAFDRGTGYTPAGGVIQGTDGYLYGVLEANVRNEDELFRVNLSGQYETLYSFPQTIGWNIGPPMQDTNGLFYGSAHNGGAYGYGAIYRLNMGLSPFITFVLPAGKVGHAAQILGQGLIGTTSVTFNGIPATAFSVESDTYMTAIVPSGATTGPVVVTTPTGTLTSNPSFRILK